MTSSADLTLVHLSDIHFRRGRVGTKYDQDEKIRVALQRDLRDLVPTFGKVSGIIITGDIAWSGHKSEYEFALSWITAMSEHLRCSLKDVMVIPGNHDVNRSALAARDKQVLKLQRKIRKGPSPATCVERLTKVLSGKEGEDLLKPIKAYNVFAKQFSCDVSRPAPYWERKFTLCDALFDHGECLVLFLPAAEGGSSVRRGDHQGAF